jgi:hypothetical protein
MSLLWFTFKLWKSESENSETRSCHDVEAEKVLHGDCDSNCDAIRRLDVSCREFRHRGEAIG